jgi:hypothetical protein
VISDEDVRAALNAIEKRELPLLSWGVTSGTLTEGELESLVRAAVPSSDPDDVIEALLDRGLILSKGLAEERYRSRMAETVRLTAALRQWFFNRDWRTAPSLVSDWRFLSRSRVVPRRDRTPDDVVQRLAGDLGAAWTSEHERALRAIAGARSVSAFQERATRRLLSVDASSRGSVVTAGTGAGKTLSFYMPVLTRLLAEQRPGGVPRVIAIYPRIELLRDQLRGLLVTSTSLANTGFRPQRVGVLYGSTPHNRRDAATERRRKWRATNDGLACPIIGCLVTGCEGTLVWPDAAQDREELVCDTCGAQLSSASFSFTRDRLRAEPPEVLFTTTEMVNSLLGSQAMRRLLVGDGRRSPEFLLLDEVHTYSGTHGAQVANLLRRWRAEVASPPHIVGLSATLADPAGFFSELTGLPTSHIAVVAPESHEMTEVGREYFLALRGDPASQTSLLSTTIQASMLLRRMLDLSPGTPSSGTFGTRVFAFTDDLDVTNRLHSQLEDAEGWQQGGINRKPSGSLATLRSASSGDTRARDEVGQVWDFAEQIGTLQRAVRVSRTTSRDSGVDPDADIVVATASLEVGFDDPNVGAVLQHKAPRDAAQFLQRRGRAGRDPMMRPWTVAVLSDYGRDRLAFQSYEALFDPVVQPTQLPLRNRVILKMQATWWLLDYLGRAGGGSSVAGVIARAWTNRARQRDVAGKLLAAAQELLTTTGTERLAAQLRRSLGVADEDVRAVLWDYPRGLLTAVLPTLIRRLQVAAAPSDPRSFSWSPVLNEFVPSALFSPLQTPEIRLITPTASSEDEVEPVSQALRQFAPGRVSYRYALGGRRERLWVAPPAPADHDLDLDAFCDSHIEVAPPSQEQLRLVQPTSIRLTQPPGPTSDSSYGRWNWRFAASHDGHPLSLDLPAASRWPSIVADLSAFTHRHRCPQTIWRFAAEFEVERNDQQSPPSTRHRLVLGGAPIAVGFASDVDALRLSVRLPDSYEPRGELLRALRVARMEYLLRTGHTLTERVPSSFTREWLHQVVLSVLVTNSNGRALNDVLTALDDDQFRDRIVDAAREVFGAVPVGAGVTTTGVPDPGLVGDLAAAVQDPAVIGELRLAASALWSDPDNTWQPWLHERLLTTLGAAVIDAIQMACPDVDASELRCDVRADTELDPSMGTITISEEQPGGIGVLEALIDRYVEDPRAFWSLVSSALGPSDGERIDSNLRAYLAVASDPAVGKPASQVRTASDLSTLTAAWRDLRLSLFERGLDSDQSVVSALSTRVLRPGSTTEVDSLIVALLDSWRDVEARLGVEVELRVFAHVAASDPGIRRRLRVVAGAQSAQAGWEIGQIVGLLWPRGHRLRASALQPYSPYSSFEPTERLLLEDFSADRSRLVDSSDPSWRQQLDDALRTDGVATVRAPSDRAAASVIRDLLTEPTSVDVLEFHPRVVGVSRSHQGVQLVVELREAQQ